MVVVVVVVEGLAVGADGATVQTAVGYVVAPADAIGAFAMGFESTGSAVSAVLVPPAHPVVRMRIGIRIENRYL